MDLAWKGRCYQDGDLKGFSRNIIRNQILELN